MAENDVILRSARFDPRLVTYFHIQSLIVLTFTFIGLPLVPIWIFVGRAFHQKQVDRMECHLTPRALLVRYGLLVRVQKSIPLDKVTDLALTEGPILRAFGLCYLGIETAGGGQGTSMGQAGLAGVVEPEEFRDAVIAQRDAVTGSAKAPAATSPDGTLEELRDAVLRIEKLLEQRQGDAG